VFSRQDVFSTANAIRNRLVKLDANATASVNNDPTSTAAHARLAAIAEIGAWAGSGRMILSTDQTSVIDGTYALPSTVYLDLIDVNPADFGLTDLSQLANATSTSGWTRSTLSLVVGAPKAAECAAGITAASAGCQPTGVLSASGSSLNTFGTPVPSAAVLRSRYGVANAGAAVAGTNGTTTKGFIRLAFNVKGGKVGDGAGAFGGWDEPFTVVLAQDPSQAPGVGEILGTLSLPVYVAPSSPSAAAARPSPPPPPPYRRPLVVYPEASTTISPMRRELVYDAFGLGHWVGAAPPKAGNTPVSATPSFCIEGGNRCTTTRSGTAPRAGASSLA
jgi:hypothetical protein